MTALKARIGGQWVTVGGVGTGEVFVGPDDPIAANPGTELWYDTDASPTVPGTWQAWIPTLTQSVSVPTSTALGRYTRIGNLVIGDFWIVASGAGTLGGVIQISRPVTGRTIASSIRSIGGAYLSIAGIGQIMAQVVDPNNGAVFHFIRTDVAAVANYFGPDPNCAIGSGNSLGGSFMYEAL